MRGAYVHPVSCVGNLHSSVIELFVRAGAPGVIVFACPDRDCVGREGPKWLHERVFNDREAELQAREDRRRVRVATIAPGDARGTIAALGAFVHDLAVLDRPDRERDAEIDMICDPVAPDPAAS
jgi:coenzyme F420-reducing hydrogenase delta subunit